MKRHISYILLLALAAASCAKDEPAAEPAAVEDFLPATLSASFGDGDGDDGGTKVHILSNNTMVWNARDEISVFGNPDNVKYIFQGHGGENYGTFSKAGSSTVGWKFDHLYALYPYSADATSETEGSIRTSIPTVQNYTASSFDKDANLMVAVTDDINAKDLRFRNVCGYLKIKLYSETDAVITGVTIRGNDNERISGECTVTAACGEMPAVTMTGEDPQDEITGGGEGFTEKGEQPKQGEGYGEKPGLWTASTRGPLTAAPSPDDRTHPRRSTIDCGEDGVRISTDKDNATEFIFAIPPTTFAKGFTVSVTDEFGGVHVKSTTKSVTVGRSRMVPFAAIKIDEEDCGTRFTEFSVTAEGGMKYTGTISENAVKILAPKSVDRTKLRAEFKTDGKDVYVGATKQESGVTVNDFTSPVTYRVVSAKGQSREYEVEILERPYLIACWGDSFTHYYYSETKSKPTHYPAILQELLGNTWEVFDGGYTGDRSNEIAARQGAITTRVKKSGGFWIPADKTPVSITTVYTDDKDLDPESFNSTSYAFRPTRWNDVSIYGHSEHMVNPCTINGVECVVKSNSITRTTPGEAVFVEDGTEIKTYAANHCKDADVTVMYLGTNGGWQHSSKNFNLLIAQHRAMIDFIGNGKYIVLLSHVPYSDPEGYQHHRYAFQGGDDQEYLSKMHEAFTDENGKDHVIELLHDVNARAEEFLVRTGVYTSADKISEADRQYINQGYWPLSFFYSSDDKHPSRYGSTAMAMLIVEKMKELGYLEK